LRFDLELESVFRIGSNGKTIIKVWNIIMAYALLEFFIKNFSRIGMANDLSLNVVALEIF